MPPTNFNKIDVTKNSLHRKIVTIFNTHFPQLTIHCTTKQSSIIYYYFFPWCFIGQCVNLFWREAKYKFFGVKLQTFVNIGPHIYGSISEIVRCDCISFQAGYSAPAESGIIADLGLSVAEVRRGKLVEKVAYIIYS